MSRVLFICYKNPLIDYSCEDSIYNVGNFVFINSTFSLLYNQNTTTISYKELDFLIIQGRLDAFIEQFDCIVLNEANLFNPAFKQSMEEQIFRFKHIKKPIYILGVGAQSDYLYSTNFVRGNEDLIKKYIDTVLQGGGTLTLRGHFTEYILEKLGYKQLYVLGCPSMYYNLDKMNITNNKVPRECFLPIFNGDLKKNKDMLLYYQNSLFFDQDIYYRLVNNKYLSDDYLKEVSSKELLLTYKQIRSYRNINSWIDEINKVKPSFSYGQRIHGNILPLLCGIPCFIDVIDSRTREIAEFYNIPNSYTLNVKINRSNIYDIYKNLDFTEFNNTYQKRYKNFLNFLQNSKIMEIKDVKFNNEEYKKYFNELRVKEVNHYSSDTIDCIKNVLRFYILKRIIRGLVGLIPIKSVKRKLRAKLK